MKKAEAIDGAPLYKADAEIAELVGVGRDKFGPLAKVWERSGFPKRDPAVGKRYWPAVRAWLGRRNGVGSAAGVAFAPDGEENGTSDGLGRPCPVA